MLSVNDRGIKELIELMAKNHPIDAGRVYMGGKLVNSYLNQEEHLTVFTRSTEKLSDQ